METENGRRATAARDKEREYYVNLALYISDFVLHGLKWLFLKSKERKN